jgi:hypothetical protein
MSNAGDQPPHWPPGDPAKPPEIPSGDAHPQGSGDPQGNHAEGNDAHGNPAPLPPALGYQPNRPLEYARPMENPIIAKTSKRMQVFAGFVAWLGAVAVAAMGLGFMQNFDPPPAVIVAWLAAVIVGLLMATFALRRRAGWTTFFPGILLGFGITCILPVGIIAVICGLGR